MKSLCGISVRAPLTLVEYLLGSGLLESDKTAEQTHPNTAILKQHPATDVMLGD